ncbi:hypothetical protein ACLI09_04160 [Flavobacterium sp. RHBU_24]|uniref:hypothetical protein n=1 Tax=Flavobacterium sp. RHBU_24 TaxID=3391185 RepID=UPI0039848140
MESPQYKSWIKHSSLVIVILCIWQIGAYLLRNYALNNGYKILATTEKNIQIQENGISHLSVLKKLDKLKILNLYREINNQKEKHKLSFLTFYPYHFTSSALLLIISSISVILIFITAQKGINNINEYGKTIFFTFASLASFYALSPLVFKVEANSSSNLKKYILYDNLLNEIYNYAITYPENTPDGETITVNQFHNSVIQQINTINNIDAEFDYKIIPTPNYGLSGEKK